MKCSLPWIFLFLGVVAALSSNFRHVMNLHNEVGKVVAANHTFTNAVKHIIELESKGNANFNHSEGSNHSLPASYFFDCNHTQSKCKYFQPGKFFRQYFMHSTKHHQNSSGMSNRYDIGLENANLPALDLLSWRSLGSPTSINAAHGKKDSNHHISLVLNKQIQNHVNLPNNVTYIHVHKCGGTSIQGAMYKRARNLRKMKFYQHQTIIDVTDTDEIKGQQRVLSLQANVHTYKHSFGGGSKEKKKQWDMDRLEHIQSIARIQTMSSYSQTSFPVIFTVVRDPIKRFLSAIQQVMHYNTDFREKCLRESSSIPLISALSSKRSTEQKEAPLRRQTIQCAIQDMKETTYRRDVHLLPIASHFRLLNKEENGKDDVVVSVFYMDDIEDVLLYLVGNKDDDNNSNSSKTTKAYHARDRSNIEYATSSILARLSINDCDEEMIHQICQLYDVDVALMKWLGFLDKSAEICN